MSKVPVIILSGFLGSGKTTLLLRLLHEANRHQLKPAILMNELGQYDVDGGTIHTDLPGASIEKLLDGCICCSKKVEVAQSVRRLLDQQPDLLFIELTGVANPEEVADALTEPYLLNRVELKHIVTVLDAEWVLDYNSIFNTDRQLVHTLRRQMEVADTVLINKTDLVPSSHLPKIEKAVKKQNSSAAIHFTKHSEMNMEGVFAGLQPIVLSAPVVKRSFKVIGSVRKQEHTANHHHEHEGTEKSFSRVQTLTLPLAENTPITLKQVERFLKQWGGQLLRAKGYLTLSNSDGSDNRLVQFAGSRISWQPTEYEGSSYLVLIGIDLDREQMEQEWAKLAN
ncbi:GTP-binding protein [Paenibacillus alkaliterrae]|uniref:CobW family GTP-binding protein n=1 Tax=Paenibacillus alkaliterrae TaxID=320909 RepID=UPI001F1CA5CA|nr:GTP-binding protein [Paenibacillus alkaliterrae]MCF2938335.1 GTP-binding protein [Paenibacillus alkaliterrae]